MTTAVAGDPPDESLANIALIIFDCDGVLIDTEPIASRTLAAILREAGVDISSAESHAKFTGHSESAIRAMCVRDYGLSRVDELFSVWHERLFAEFSRSLTAMPGIARVVAQIRRPKCVASNSTMERLQSSLGLLDLWHVFAPGIFSAEAVARPKPAPDLLLHAVAEFKAAPEQCVMIDDSPHGVVAAVAAGMLAIGFVDPADPRPQRKELLAKSGAFAVAVGAAELIGVLQAANQALATEDAAAARIPRGQVQ